MKEYVINENKFKTSFGVEATYAENEASLAVCNSCFTENTNLFVL